MRVLPKAAVFLYTLLVGRAPVKEHHFARAVGMFKGVLEESAAKHAHLVPDDVCVMLVHESYRRAASKTQGVVLWKFFLAELVAVGECISAVLNGEQVEDKRITAILTLHHIT